MSSHATSYPARAMADMEVGRHTFRRFILENGLSLVLMFLFFAFWIGQTVTGYHVYNEELTQSGGGKVTFWQYVGSGHWWEATAENWESEFLQMGAFVCLTAYLFQKGSPESRDPYADPLDPPVTDESPWPARRGGWIKTIYNYSLSIAFALLFFGSFAMHAVGGAAEYNREQLAHGQPTVSTLGFMGTSQFWFDSFQNWQSEFLAIAAMVLLTIWLRHEGSPESKSPATPHRENEDH
jgi:hypothetical protein